MPGYLADRMQVDAEAEHDAGARVAQIVEIDVLQVGLGPCAAPG